MKTPKEGIWANEFYNDMDRILKEIVLKLAKEIPYIRFGYNQLSEIEPWLLDVFIGMFKSPTSGAYYNIKIIPKELQTTLSDIEIICNGGKKGNWVDIILRGNYKDKRIDESARIYISKREEYTKDELEKAKNSIFVKILYYIKKYY